ncbi:hypothetical protein Xen7305DRAFT_00020670 [Xenococcus sp. PCC 7305]|uniref:hypothetical protein n=1 Tax=Xenococcus sp. PCC 7305 TaxID=102125 RepID=UPI0002ACB6E0|nr:hypothetical protein [Xenococcus sp. PCC 7305]ELS02353.1 hypothetical protein Xen7305DRAFT_00020670 [Xenococcus sp. PCC 7305]
MNVIICPGIHEPKLTDSFIASLSLEDNSLVFPANHYPAYDSWHIYDWIQKQKLVSQELLFVTFSAGVVGGIGAAIALQLSGFKITAFIAIDGWGVPLFPMFPIYRLSHDHFTHWSSAILGAGDEGFYADPAKSHLELWSAPENCWGCRVSSKNQLISRCTARDYLKLLMSKTY